MSYELKIIGVFLIILNVIISIDTIFYVVQRIRTTRVRPTHTTTHSTYTNPGLNTVYHKCKKQYCVTEFSFQSGSTRWPLRFEPLSKKSVLTFYLHLFQYIDLSVGLFVGGLWVKADTSRRCIKSIFSTL